MNMILNRQGRQGRHERRFLMLSFLGVPGVLAVDFFCQGFLQNNRFTHKNLFMGG
jgi:hypothetical protein